VKDADGSVEAMELSDLEDLGELQVLEAELAELLAEDDVLDLAAAMDPGSVAGVQRKEPDMLLGPGRVGVIGLPVAKTAVVAAAVTPGRGRQKCWCAWTRRELVLRS
jgi:hypothetical protein